MSLLASSTHRSQGLRDRFEISPGTKHRHRCPASAGRHKVCNLTTIANRVCYQNPWATLGQRARDASAGSKRSKLGKTPFLAHGVEARWEILRSVATLQVCIAGTCKSIDAHQSLRRAVPATMTTTAIATRTLAGSWQVARTFWKSTGPF